MKAKNNIGVTPEQLTEAILLAMEYRRRNTRVVGTHSVVFVPESDREVILEELRKHWESLTGSVVS